jgi:hypothetical protein
MNLALCILFLIGAMMPGFFLVNFFRDAYAEYKHTGKFYWETLFGNPTLFILSLIAFTVLLALAVMFGLGVL